jgi:hypothetical protein
VGTSFNPLGGPFKTEATLGRPAPPDNDNHPPKENTPLKNSLALKPAWSRTGAVLGSHLESTCQFDFITFAAGNNMGNPTGPPPKQRIGQIPPIWSPPALRITKVLCLAWLLFDFALRKFRTRFSGHLYSRLALKVTQ